MRMNRKLVLIASLLLSVAMGTTGTIAYLQDTDSQVNVMTLGRVEIEQHEQERVPAEGAALETAAETGDTVLQKFTNAQPAYPVVGDYSAPSASIKMGGVNYSMFNPNNVIDKIVTVENIGKSDAYVRTIIAIEAPGYDEKELIFRNVNSQLFDKTVWAPYVINEAEYLVAEFVYDEALAPGKITAPSLLQVFLKSEATNEDIEPFGDTWDILALSQGVQTAGFEAIDTMDETETVAKSAAKNALDTAFGEVNQENVTKWFGSLEIPGVIEDYAGIIEVKGKDGTYILGQDIDTEDIVLPGNGSIKLDLNGKTITAEKKDQFAFGAQQGGVLHLTGDGTVNMGKGFLTSKGDAEIIIDGGTYTMDTTTRLNSKYHHSVIQNTGKMVINGGTFIGKVDNATLFMATSNARLEINGGFFENTADKTPDLLEVGGNKDNTNRIILKGGTFVNYNPLEDRMTYTDEWPAGGEAAFGGPWILIPGDYMVVSETQANGDVWYSVVPK